MQTVEQLRKSGLRVRVIHRRAYPGSPVFLTKEQAEAVKVFVNIGDVFPRGGVTEVYVNDGKSKSKVGVAECSLKDNYNKVLGVNLALERALKSV